MRATLGILGLAAGFAACLMGISVLALGLRRGDPRLLRSGRRFVFVAAIGAVVAVGAMEWALVTHDFSLAYVARNGSRSTPLLYTVASLWGALEGSILLWLIVLMGYLTVVVRVFRHRASEPVVAWATLVGLVIATFFFALVLGPANPFERVAGAVPLDGPGPNPLLQNHPLMAVHPPMLYLGYVGFTVPFAFAIGALVTGRVDDAWASDTRRAAVVAWTFLTAGIILGGWWSYEVLGWGGYWAWDPVENASLLPWLTGTAYLHSVIVQERRGLLRVWNLSLLVATFCLTILGTFLTRSGVVNSVHAFTQSAIGPSLLAFLGVAAGLGVGLIAWRGDRLRSPAQVDSPVSREAAFLVNNLLFAAFAAVVLVGTVFPLLAEAVDGRQLSVGEPYFDRMTLPVGIALLFLMAVAPALPWRAAGPGVLHRRLAVPAWTGAGTMAIAVLLGARGIAQVATFGLAAFALAGIARQVISGTKGRRGAHGESWPLALVRLTTGDRRLYGGLAVHVGVVLVAVALAASSGYMKRREVRLGEGESATLRGYTVTYLGSKTSESARRTMVSANLEVRRDGDRLGVYAPALATYPAVRQSIGTPSVRTGALRDLYLTLVSTPNDAGRVTIGIMVNPMVLWLWVGGGVMFAGGLFAAWPGGRRRTPRARSGAAPADADADPDADADGAADAPVLEGTPG